jgi:hypothetical protein
MTTFSIHAERLRQGGSETYPQDMLRSGLRRHGLGEAFSFRFLAQGPSVAGLWIMQGCYRQLVTQAASGAQGQLTVAGDDQSKAPAATCGRRP